MDTPSLDASEFLAPLEVRPHIKKPVGKDGWHMNCIGWSVKREEWIFDDDWGESSLEAQERFMRFYYSEGYRLIFPYEAFSESAEYVVLMHRNGRPTHAFRYDQDRGWTSKDGAMPLYAGNCPQALFNKEAYGVPLAVMTR